MPPSDPRQPSGSGDEAARRAIEEVLREQEERRGRQAPPAPGPRRTATGPLLAAALVLNVLAVAVWTSPPGWTRPEPFAEPSPERLEAGLRMDIWVTVRKIRRFQEERRRLPVGLVEVDPGGGGHPDLRYERLSAETFRLVGSREGVEVVYDSAGSAGGLIDSARALIGDPGP